MNNNNNNTNNSYKSRLERHLKNQSKAQRNYRARLKDKGFRQLNTLIRNDMYEKVKRLLKMDPDILVQFIESLDIHAIENESKNKSALAQTSKIQEASTDIKETPADIKSDYYLGNFTERLKISNAKAGSEKDINAAKRYIDTLRRYIKQTKGLSELAACNSLWEIGYFTLSKEGLKIPPSRTLLRKMRVLLLTEETNRNN